MVVGSMTRAPPTSCVQGQSGPQSHIVSIRSLHPGHTDCLVNQLSGIESEVPHLVTGGSFRGGLSGIKTCSLG